MLVLFSVSTCRSALSASKRLVVASASVWRVSSISCYVSVEVGPSVLSVVPRMGRDSAAVAACSASLRWCGRWHASARSPE